MPKPKYKVLVLTDNFEQESLQINHANLMDCQHNNLLKHLLNSTCLGALYSQQWNDAIDLRRMEIGHQQEAVLHLNSAKYLVYSPTSFTAPIQCGEDANAQGQEKAFKASIMGTKVP